MSALQALYQELSQKKKPHSYAVIDFDNTCIFNDIGEATIAYQCEQMLLRNPRLLSGKQRITPDYHQKVFHKYHNFLDANKIQEAYEFGAQMLAGYTLGELRDLLVKVVRSEGKKIGTRTLFGRSIAKGLKPKPRPTRLLKYLHSETIDIWIISASPKPLVEPLFTAFFPSIPYHCIGIETEQSKDILTDRLVFPTPTFAGKVECIKKYIHPVKRPLLAVGDSVNDLSMLEYADVKAVVDRMNNLTKIAQERKYYLI